MTHPTPPREGAQERVRNILEGMSVLVSDDVIEDIIAAALPPSPAPGLDPATVEATARAIWLARPRDPDEPDDYWREWIPEAEAAIHAITPSPAPEPPASQDHRKSYVPKPWGPKP